MKAKIRKLMVITDETMLEMSREISPPTRRAAAVAVIENPFAGRYVEDLTDLMDIGAELGGFLGERCVAALGIKPGEAQSYGKAAMVGENGELEHAAAILHPRLGAPLRKAVEKGRGACSLLQEDGIARPGPRHPARPQGCGLCALAFRRHGGAHSTMPRGRTRSWWRWR